MSRLEALAQLQDFDLRLAQLQHRVDHLPEVAERDALFEAIAALGHQRSTFDDQKATLQRDQKRHEDTVAAVVDKTSKSEQALYGGAITSPKEASAMQAELASLSRRQEAIEDEILAVMELIEPVDAEIDAINEQREHLEAQLAEVDARIGEATAEVERERVAVQAERDLLAASTSQQLIELYDRQRANMRGSIAVGRLIGTTCGACHIDMSAVDVDHIRSLGPEEPGECAQCGALLVH